MRPHSYDEGMRPRALTIALALYTVAMFMWFFVIEYGARLEPDHGERFLRLSGWPTTVAVVGLAWTALLVGAVVGAFRERHPIRVACLAATTLVAASVAMFLPVWLGRLGYLGPSASEYLDVFFMPLGGILPGGQATLGLRVTTGLLAVLTLVALGFPTSRRGPVIERDGTR